MFSGFSLQLLKWWINMIILWYALSLCNQCLSLILPAVTGNSLFLLQREETGKFSAGLCHQCMQTYPTSLWSVEALLLNSITGISAAAKELVLLALILICEWVNMTALLALPCCILVFESIFSKYALMEMFFCTKLAIMILKRG